MLAVAVVFVFVVTTVSILTSIHHIEEGHVGVYWRGGALLNKTTEPGYRLKMPFIDRVANIQITMQTDSVTNIPCGTSGGVTVYFEKIEVVNRLKKQNVHNTILNYGENYDKLWIYEKIHHEINQFCSKHSLQQVYIDLFDELDESLMQSLQEGCDKYDTGIEIITVRVTKPKIPELLRQNYEKVEAEKTRLMVAVQTQTVVEKEAETERKRATIEAEKLAQVSKIQIQQQVYEKDAKKKMSEIEDTMHLAREKSRSDAEYYKRTREAEANAKMLTPQYLKMMLIKSLMNNSKIYYGDSIPKMLINLEANELKDYFQA
ncbi:hypothetical protein AKO1_008879 [Acrasis kona]|uniref:Band 7 domain-containing protein n=1 Tax=Acrasis kona TaxID=1008807 RepID=A0AAW2ZEV3_9EUKA